MDNLFGIYIASKSGTFITLQAKDENLENEVIDYFKFELLLFKFFDHDVIKKILNYLNEHKKVIIDFSKNKALLIKDLQPNFLKIFMSEFDSKKIEAFYADCDNDFSNNNYIKPILGDNENVESICRQSTNS